jgi:hypothetical protein
MTRYQFTVSYTEDLVRRADRAYFEYRLRHDFWSVYLCLATLLCFGLYGAFRHDWSGLYLKADLGLVSLIVMLFLGYRAHLRYGAAKLKAMGAPTAAIVVTDDGLTATSGSGAGDLPWSDLSDIVETQEFWLLRLKNKSKITIPIQGINPAVLSFIRSKLGSTRRVA